MLEAKAFLRGTSTGRAGGFPIQKDECSYSFSNAIRTLAMKPDFNLDIFDISEFTSQFLKGTTCRFIVADHCRKSKCYSANAHLFVQSRQEYSIFAVVAALFS